MSCIKLLWERPKARNCGEERGSILHSRHPDFPHQCLGGMKEVIGGRREKGLQNELMDERRVVFCFSLSTPAPAVNNILLQEETEDG